MDMPSTRLRKLALKLLAIEAASSSTVNPNVHEAVRVCDKLRISLTRLAGSDGFASLLRRALTLARMENPALQVVTVRPDGSLEGLEALAADSRNGGPEAAVAITTHLLGLLVTFIGESLTHQLVLEAWPDASLEDY